MRWRIPRRESRRHRHFRVRYVLWNARFGSQGIAYMGRKLDFLEKWLSEGFLELQSRRKRNIGLDWVEETRGWASSTGSVLGDFYARSSNIRIVTELQANSTLRASLLEPVG